MFSMDDFNKDSSFYDNIPDMEDDGGDFTTTLMMITHQLKNMNYEESLKSGHHLMMTIFNMSGLEPSEENEQALNVIMALLSHTFGMCSFIKESAGQQTIDDYFQFFDESVIYPMINGGGNELD